MKLDVLKQNPYWNKTKNKLRRCYCSKTKAPTEKYKLSKSQKDVILENYVSVNNSENESFEENIKQNKNKQLTFYKTIFL